MAYVPEDVGGPGQGAPCRKYIHTSYPRSYQGKRKGTQQVTGDKGEKKFLDARNIFEH